MHLRSEKLICWRSQDTYQGTRYHGGGTRGRCGVVAAVAERRSLPREIRVFYSNVTVTARVLHVYI